jgi:hypothetical protein
MNKKLHSLAYFSRNRILGAPADIETEIRKILASARRHNRERQITGALLFSDGCFAQVLEGELAEVEAIFETIQCDPRHSDVTVLHVHSIEARSFGSWSMAFGGIAGVSVDPKIPVDEQDGGAALLLSDAGQTLMATLRSIVHRDDVARRDDL